MNPSGAAYSRGARASRPRGRVAFCRIPGSWDEPVPVAPPPVKWDGDVASHPVASPTVPDRGRQLPQVREVSALARPLSVGVLGGERQSAPPPTRGRPGRVRFLLPDPEEPRPGPSGLCKGGKTPIASASRSPPSPSSSSSSSAHFSSTYIISSPTRTQSYRSPSFIPLSPSIHTPAPPRMEPRPRIPLDNERLMDVLARLRALVDDRIPRVATAPPPSPPRSPIQSSRAPSRRIIPHIPPLMSLIIPRPPQCPSPSSSTSSTSATSVPQPLLTLSIPTPPDSSTCPPLRAPKGSRRITGRSGATSSAPRREEVLYLIPPGPAPPGECYQCRQPGHRRVECTQPPRFKYCYWCGWAGVCAAACPRCAGAWSRYRYPPREGRRRFE